MVSKVEQTKNGKSTGIRSDNYSKTMSYLNLRGSAMVGPCPKLSIRKDPLHLRVGRVALETPSLK